MFERKCIGCGITFYILMDDRIFFCNDACKKNHSLLETKEARISTEKVTTTNGRRDENEY